MSELSPSKVASQRDDNVTTSDVTRSYTLFAGRCRLKNLFLMDTSRGVDAGTSYIQFRNGSVSGDVFLKVYPNLTPIFYNLFDNQALSFEIPGNGILFPDGMYVSIFLQGVTSGDAASKARGLTVTAIYS
jgi:hypothetical protein